MVSGLQREAAHFLLNTFGRVGGNQSLCFGESASFTAWRSLDCGLGGAGGRYARRVDARLFRMVCVAGSQPAWRCKRSRLDWRSVLRHGVCNPRMVGLFALSLPPRGDNARAFSSVRCADMASISFALAHVRFVHPANAWRAALSLRGCAVLHR